MKKLLIISHKSPFAPVDGGVLAIRNLFFDLQISGNFKVDFCCLTTDKHPDNNLENQKKHNYSTFKIDTGLNPWQALKHLATGKSYNVSRFYNSEFSEILKKKVLNESYDFILFESLFSTVYLNDLKPIFKGKLIYRSHNIEHHIWQRLMNQEGNHLKKWYLKTLTKSLKKYEEGIHNEFDGIFSISKSDLEYYKSNTETKCHLLFFTRPQIERKTVLDPTSFFHLGSMDWQPNIEAVDWFVTKVWKPAYKVNSKIRLNLAGKHMPEKYFTMQKFGINAKDYIDEGDIFMQNHGTLVVPLFSGSGIRIKVVDALSLEVPILSTSIGVSGIGLESDLHYIEANNELEFQEKIIQMASENIDLSKIISNSKSFASLNFDSFNVMSKFNDQLNNL